MTALALSSSEKSRISVVLSVKDMYTLLALMKSAKSRDQGYCLSLMGIRFTIFIFENDPQFSIVPITRRPIRQKAKENLFSI